MKRLSTILPVWSAVALLFAAPTAGAQTVPGPALSGLDSGLMRLFGEHKAFSAEAVLRVYDTNEQEVLSTTADFAVQGQQLRMDLDMSKLKSKALPAGVAGSLHQLGMDQVVSLVLPEKRSSYIIYPGLESILKVPMDEENLRLAASDFRLQREVIGSETLDGHRCTKHRVTVTDALGGKQQAITWNATDLKDFPLQIQMADRESLMILRFRNPNLMAPKAELFVVPSGFKQYNSQEALIQAVIMKALGRLGNLGGQ